jgi:cytidine deaminase
MPEPTNNRGLSEAKWNELAEIAWQCRRNAYIQGDTRVGAAVLSRGGKIFGGCNLEHIFRCHDVHAEINAITSMVAAGETDLKAIIIAAECGFFTPCGGCLDWIFQLGGADCLVACQSRPGGEIKVFTAGDLMPHYPRY